MTRQFYSFCIFLTGLYMAITIFQSLMHIQIGAQFYLLPASISWLVLGNVINIILTLALFKYYYHKKYKYTLVLGIIFMVIYLFHLVVVFNILIARELESFFTITFSLYLVAAMIYAASLVFSDAAKRPWLKITGFSLFIVELIILLTFIWSLNTQDFQMKVLAEKILLWVAFVGNLVFVPIIMNFLNELKTLKAEKADVGPRNSWRIYLDFIKVMALFLTVLLGGMMFSQSIGHWKYINRGSERAQTLAEPFEARTYVNSEGDTLRYRLMKPLNYDPVKQYPLVVGLHHGGGSGTDNIKQIETSDPIQKLSIQVNREKYPAFLFVPQCPPGASFGGLGNLPAIDELVFEAIGALEEEFEIDESRRYVLGVSLGGYGSWHFISVRPEMFAAAIPICGRGDPDFAQKIIEVPVWAFHGAKDRNVPVKFSREVIEAMKKAGGNPLYNEYPEAGHNIWGKVNNTPGLLDWMFAQKRDSLPV